ncbi:MAG TPA: helix-turn-helix domain-containing protein [Candidatus Saccharimonadales bacterium]|jgi:AcrR family transcriptional regulator|nr:helix-turn-helix domain-containing protein [Candidatus Saccharimonadales bacterium]
MAGSKIYPLALEAAIRLFSLHGYEGVTMRDVAQAVDTTDATIFRLFKSRKKLYEQALDAAVTRSLEAVANAVFIMVDQTGKHGDLPTMLTDALRRWYEALGEAETRLLQRVLTPGSKHWEIANGTREKMVTHLATALKKKTKTAAKLDSHNIAKLLVYALLELKVSAPNKKFASEQMKGLVVAWLKMCLAA